MNNAVIRDTPQFGPDQPILQPLVITLRVVMHNVFRDRSTQRRLPVMSRISTEAVKPLRGSNS